MAKLYPKGPSSAMRTVNMLQATDRALCEFAHSLGWYADRIRTFREDQSKVDLIAAALEAYLAQNIRTQQHMLRVIERWLKRDGHLTTL